MPERNPSPQPKVSLRDRMSSLTRGELAGLAALALLTLVGASFWYVRSLPRAVAVGVTAAASPVMSVAPPASGAPSTFGPTPFGASQTPSAAPVIVDVAGWVRHPGVYTLEEGDRVIDAIKAAGGPRHGADLTSLNLASVVADGSQILVDKKGEGSTTGTSSGSDTGTTSGTTGSLININTATESELETLPGVGPVLGAAIISYRTNNGPFGSVDELDNVSGIGPVTLAQLKPLVTV
jgi:competence protein ComEA